MKIIRTINIILAACLVAACTVMLSFAEDGSELTIYNTRIVTNDTNATYIEGEVPVARGQEIVVSNGFTTIAAKTLPDTNEKAEFRIKIPSKKISKSRVTVVYVKTENDASDSGMILGKRVEINYKERKAQEISTADNKFSMTYPGLDAPLEAKATSGDELLYISSNPDVATVDKNGNICTTTGNWTGNFDTNSHKIITYDENDNQVPTTTETRFMCLIGQQWAGYQTDHWEFMLQTSLDHPYYPVNPNDFGDDVSVDNPVVHGNGQPLPGTLATLLIGGLCAGSLRKRNKK